MTAHDRSLHLLGSEPPPFTAPEGGEPFGKYRLLERVGFGGMAEVYRARASGIEGFEKIVVVKKILPNYARNQAFIDLLIAEAKICSALSHPNIVPIHDLGALGDEYFLVMEYVHGADLLALLQAAARAGQPVPDALALYIISLAAEGLAYAHKATDTRGRPLNVIHRDVSPANLMVSYEGAVKVTDFGVARADIEVARPLRTAHGLQGKLSYMSPELASGHPIDHRSDIFALGVVLWEMLTLKRLFLGRSNEETLENVRQVRVERRFAKHDYIPAGIQAIISRALAPTPDERYASAAELARAVRDYLFEERLRVEGSDLAAYIRRMVPDPNALVAARSTAPRGVFGADTPDAERADAFDGAEGSLAGASLDGSDPRTPEFGPGDAWSDLPDGDAGALAEPYVDELLVALEREAADAEAEREARTASGRPATPTPAPPPDLAAPSGVGDADAEAATQLLGIPLSGSIQVKDGGGALIGTVSPQVFQRLLQSRAVTSETQVSVDGGTWKRISHTDLARLRPQLFDEGGREVHSGPIGQAWTPRLFHQLGAARVNGMLKVVHDWVTKEVFYRDGRVVHVHSNLKSELLASVVEGHGLVTEHQIEAALARTRALGVKLGEALVATGALTEAALAEVLAAQLRARFVEIFAWREGSFTFFDGCQLPEYASRVGVDARQLFGAALRAHYELGALKAMFYPYMGYRVTRAGETPVVPTGFGLDDHELAWAVTLARGADAPLGRMVIDSATEGAFWRALFLLVQTDMVALVGDGVG